MQDTSPEELVLRAVEELSSATDSIDSQELSERISVPHDQLVDGPLKSLNAREAVRLETVTHDRWHISAEGNRYADSTSPEVLFFQAVASSPTPPDAAALESALGKEVCNRGKQQALKRRWVSIDKATKSFVTAVAASAVTDDVGDALRSLRSANGRPDVAQLPADMLKTLKSRKLTVSKPFKTYRIHQGDKLGQARVKQATELTRDMLESGEWKDVIFKPYNFHAEGKVPDGGYLHTLLKVREQFRLIFLEMGFEEMPTNNYVESSFWNFDTLFQPQQHPARDEHDTFFLSDPAHAKIPDEDYKKRVQQVHENGGFGSRGYRYEWSQAEATKNILRTHTTAISSRMLYMLAKETERDGFKPKKYFSIDRVFRNETLDATHLAEFHQIEGLVADKNLSLGHLKGVIHQFFIKMGMDKLRFKPTHNPYTTPSLEVHAYHEGLQKWVEVGNSGIFRPEMIRPMGIPEDVTVIAWGLSLERPTMIKYGVKNIRDLFGHKVDLKAIQSNPICRLTF